MCIGHFSEEVPAQQATHHIVLSYYHESWSKADEHKCRGSAQVELRVSWLPTVLRGQERGWAGQAHRPTIVLVHCLLLDLSLHLAEDLLLHAAFPPTGSFSLPHHVCPGSSTWRHLRTCFRRHRSPSSSGQELWPGD